MKLSDNNGQTIDFLIPDETKTIGVNCSGGADSAILLYMVCEYIKTHKMETSVAVLTCANDAKHRWNARKAADVINYTIDRLQWNQIDIHYAYYRSRQETTHFHKVEGELFDDNRIDMLVAGITANPKLQSMVVNSAGEAVDLAVDALTVRNVDAQPVDFNSRYVTPFVNVDKRFVASMYQQYNVMDLLDLTRSCESLPDAGTPFDPEFEKNPCGLCWWCLERKWAFGRF
jgi:7-cyano-7-deazaguanine synthase in queuosine biosynthesis